MKTLAKPTKDALATIQRILGHMQGSRPDYVQPGWLKKVEEEGLVFDATETKASVDFLHQKVRKYKCFHKKYLIKMNIVPSISYRAIVGVSILETRRFFFTSLTKW